MGYEDSRDIDILRVANFLGFEPIKVTDRIYRDKVHDSLTFFTETNSFAWYSQIGQDTRGSSFNLVKLVLNCTFPEAKKFLIKNGLYNTKYINNQNFETKNIPEDKKLSMDTVSQNNKNNIQEVKKEKKQKLQFKAFNKDNKKMFEYLKIQRGIDERVIWKLIKRKLIFFDVEENINFIAMDKNKKWKNITKRTINSKNFFACYGGDKNYPFCINNNVRDFVIAEGEIDAISCYEIYGNKFNYLSTPATTLKGILHYIDEFNVKNCKINLLLDNDKAGEKATQEYLEILKEHTKDRNILIQDVRDKVLPDNVKDINDLLRIKKGIKIIREEKLSLKELKDNEKNLKTKNTPEDKKLSMDTVSQNNKNININSDNSLSNNVQDIKNVSNTQNIQNGTNIINANKELKKTKKLKMKKGGKLIFI